MATYTLTGDLGNLVGGLLASPNGAPPNAYLEPAATAVVEAGEVRVGDLELTLDTTDQTFAVTVPQGSYQVRVDYFSQAQGQTVSWTSDSFLLDDDLDLGVIVGGLFGWPAPYDTTAATLRPRSAPLATLTVNPGASPSSTNYTTIAGALTQATALQLAAVQAGTGGPEFSSWGNPYGPDYRVDIIISPGTYVGSNGTGQWVCLIGATGNPNDVILTSSTTGAGTIQSFGPIYMEGITLRSTGSGSVPSGPKYPWHITNGIRGCSIAVNCKFIETNTGGEGAAGMDGGEGTTALFYACTLSGKTPGTTITNMHGAAPNTIPVTTMWINCTLNGNVSYDEIGSATDEVWFINTTGGNLTAPTGSVNSHTTGAWPVPARLLSALDVAYFRPGTQVGDVQTFGASDQAAFSPPVGRSYYIHVIADRAIHRTHNGVIAAAAGGVVGLRSYRGDIPPTDIPTTNTSTLVIGANEAAAQYNDTFYPGETAHVWVQVDIVSGTPSLQGSLVMGNAAGSYYSDNGGTTQTLVPGGTRVPVVRIRAAN